jgi:hypothetical protein
MWNIEKDTVKCVSLYFTFYTVCKFLEGKVLSEEKTTAKYFHCVFKEF